MGVRQGLRCDHPALRPDPPAASAVRDWGPAFPAVDVDAATAPVVPLLEGAALRGDVQGLLDADGAAAGDGGDVVELHGGEWPEGAWRSLYAGEEP